METKKVYCDVCNLHLNSPDQYAMHLLGKQHVRKVQGQAQTTHTAANNNTATASSTTSNNSTNSNFNTIMSSNNQQPQTSIWQPLSGTGYTYDYGQTQTITTTATTTVNLNAEGAQTMAMNNTPMESSNPGTTNQGGEKEEKPTQPKEKKPTEPHFCAVCLVSLTSKAQAEVHFSGLKHKKTLALKTQTQIVGVKRKREEYCDVCNVSLSSNVLAEAHYAGSKHEKKMKLVTKVSTGAIPAMPYQTSTSTNEMVTSTVNIGSSAPPAKTKKELDPLTMAQLHCYFCNISVNSLAQLTAHQSGSKHKQKARQLPSQRTQTQPYQTQAYQAQPYQAQPYQAQPYPTQPYQANMMAPNFPQQQQQGYQYAGPGAYFPDLKSSFIFGETTQQNLSY